jgi:peptidoglycan L-alanyl-D-glutamate endopeptidase CwlK
MAFKLSGRSLGKLEGVHPVLVDTVKRAIEVSSVDFGVIYGVRSLAEQKRLYEAKRSQTMKSKHLVQEDAWQIDDIAKWDGTMEQAMNAYIDLRRSQSRRPFIDGPHFQSS